MYLVVNKKTHRLVTETDNYFYALALATSPTNHAIYKRLQTDSGELIVLVWGWIV